jgi:hypothetical protein
MISEQGQVEQTPDGSITICPQCGTVLKPAGGSMTVVKVEPCKSSPLLWHRSRPDFPPPPGCRRIWIPFRGYLDVDEDIRKRVDRFFNVPMLTLALLVLPLLVVDYYVTRGEDSHKWLTSGVMTAHITISIAFLVEFVVKVGIAQSRLGYMARNWIDPIIIVLPFLRPLQSLRTIRFLKPLQAAKVVQFSRVYAVRGVGLKAVRTMVPLLLGLRFTQRFRNRSAMVAGGKPDYSKWPRAALLLEVERLHQRVHELEEPPVESARAACADVKA